MLQISKYNQIKKEIKTKNQHWQKCSNNKQVFALIIKQNQRPTNIIYSTQHIM